MTEVRERPEPDAEPAKPSKQLRCDSTASGAAVPPSDGQIAAPRPEHAQPAEAASDAEAAEQVPQQQAVDLVDPREAAITMLRGIGVSSERASEAVDQTQDVYVSTDAAAWADAAQVWLAEDLEHSAERDKLAEAMAASLAEEQQRKQTAAPLADRPDEELEQRFARSILLPKFEWTAFDRGLLDPALRPQLVALLELERQYSCLWYPGPGTDQYFEDMARECVDAAEEVVAQERAGEELRKGQIQRSREVGRRAAGGRRRDRPPARMSVPAGPQYPSPAAVAKWADCLAEKVKLLREQLAPADWLPSAPGEVPPFLAPYARRAAEAAADGDADDGDVVITN